VSGTNSSAVVSYAHRQRKFEYGCRVREQDPRVPQDVEDYLVGQIARAGELGSVLGAAPGGRRGGTRGAQRLKTVVAERSGMIPAAAADDLAARVVAELPRAKQLDVAVPEDLVRMVVPVGITGLQRIVVDLSATPAGDSAEVRVRAYGKEGLLSRKPTEATAEKVLEALTSPSGG
jgi:hypothetical protein